MKSEIRIAALRLAAKIGVELPGLESLDANELSEALATLGYAVAIVAAKTSENHHLFTAPVVLQGARIGLQEEDNTSFLWTATKEGYGDYLSEEDMEGKEVDNGFGTF